MATQGRIVALVCALAGIAFHAEDALAWDAQTTNAGIAQKAALSSQLHKRLVLLGFEHGLLTELTLTRKYAPELYKYVDKVNPVHGYVPNRAGKQRVLGWIALGAAIADSYPNAAACHFLEPKSGKSVGEDAVTPGTIRTYAIRGITTRNVMHTGNHKFAAPDALTFLAYPKGAYSVPQFESLWKAAIEEKDPAKRSAQTARALIALGGIIHVLSDMGSPAHVRGDVASFYEQADRNDRLDFDSRFERLAALSFGRVGIPSPAAKPIVFADWRAFFANDQQSGLAQIISRRWFSAKTLPRPVRVRPSQLETNEAMRKRLTASVVRPKPAIPANLDILGAQTQKARIVNPRGKCVAEYTIRDYKLSWSMSYECMLEQQTEILPMVVRYSAGLINLLTSQNLPAPKPKRVIRRKQEGPPIDAITPAPGEGPAALPIQKPKAPEASRKNPGVPGPASATKKPATKKPATKKPEAKKTTTKKPATKKTTTKKPTTEGSPKPARKN